MSTASTTHARPSDQRQPGDRLLQHPAVSGATSWIETTLKRWRHAEGRIESTLTPVGACDWVVRTSSMQTDWTVTDMVTTSEISPGSEVSLLWRTRHVNCPTELTLRKRVSTDWLHNARILSGAYAVIGFGNVFALRAVVAYWSSGMLCIWLRTCHGWTLIPSPPNRTVVWCTRHSLD